MARPALPKLTPPAAAKLDGSLSDQVYQRLRWALMLGDFAPGDGISIRRVARELGTSMTPVREALKRLASERALTSSANRSFRVAALEPKRIADLFFVRACLEAVATELATPKLTTGQVGRLDALARLMDQDIARDDARRYLSRNYSFHFTIYTAAGNDELVSVIEGLWAQTGPFLAAGVRSLGLAAEWRNKHGEIAEAIRARDATRARRLVELDIDWGTRVYQAMAGTGSGF